MSTQNPAASAGTPHERLAACERELHANAAGLQRSNNFTLIVGVGLIALLGGYFWYGYSEISSVLNPDKLVSLGEMVIEDNLPEVRKKLEVEVTASAPIWAESLSKQAQDSLPQLRGKLEEHILAQVEVTLEKTVEMTEDEFRKFLKENKDVLNQGFVDLKSSPHLAEATLERVEHAFEQQFASNLKQDAHDLYATLEQMQIKLERLKANVSLAADEVIERRLLMLARRIQKDKVNAAN